MRKKKRHKKCYKMIYKNVTRYIAKWLKLNDSKFPNDRVVGFWLIIYRVILEKT